MKKTANIKFNHSISEIISNSDLSSDKQIIGIVKSYGDGVVKVSGLDDVKAGELIDLGNDQFGLALNLEKEETGIVVLGDALHLKAGATVKKTGKILSINVSDSILGRTVDVLGRVLDGRANISVGKQMLLEKKAPGIMPRKSVTQPLHTGLKAIDALVPIGRGQRELIIGDRSTGKTAVALGTILNQTDQDVICVYVCIGQKRSSLAQTIDILTKNNAMDYTVIVAATASVSAAEQFLAPYAGQAIAEYFLEKGKDVLIIFDDLTKHAQAYREISLLLKRPSGREAYPGDVFYLHSRLLERSCKLNDANGGGSITALPIIETQDNDVSAFIPTNVISITDGQIYLESDLFNAGMKPAINVGLSVSRVGGAAQVKATKQVAGTMKLDLAQFRELQAFAQFSSDLDEKTKAQLDRGERVNAILKQGWDAPQKFEEEVVVIYAAVKGYLDLINVDDIQKWEALYLEFIKNSYSHILKSIVTEKKLLDKTEKELIEAIKTFNSMNPEFSLEVEE
ncbi:MAG: F0F1 ATP synthase subunit alpha [Candidatus Pacebacteria bacterium CG1_02_43_31]|nr:F0F1 ATP synthase subunit alpha [Candidatus Paceibacterota bacterium]NCS86669.1 F0F1 ATP synthase subunit alpha [Candidatus Paceibacterota bacterium]OIO44820.1 MAG: F0F1 ATP synthase subunit alpha [Candidatus Pacebacteria bacterium CG1_02_43_31]PIQ81300.1 MAG: F0F1 ATP synthase subunit alpha [Candidatus Pacebacteria bacterium CG11_big_fil_rev_8_21_14_0_20_34_55]PJC43846.1 MAG: F0F1 ATP synthase subunit alpha [Candidatus Pacebacteria bacterium CG_4_9_14_0_2_um_filter_34_50]